VDWLRPAVTRCDPKPDHEGAIPVAVHEQYCASGRNPIPYLDEPEVDYRKRAVLIRLWIHPPEGASTCQSNPVGHTWVRLPEPLGTRALFDGSSDPPRHVKPGEDIQRLRR